jgi:GT2 family glycosyltransferase
VITAVVVNWNGGDALLATLRSLLPLDVVVVDNASTDGSAERVAAELPEVRLIRNPTNRGLAAANNQGIAASSTPYVLICNPDVLVAPGAVEALRATLERHPRAAWAIAKLVRPDGSVQTSVGDLPTLGDALLGRSWQRMARRAAGTGFWWDGWGHDEEVAVGHGMEACFLVRRAAIDDIGGQDERFPLDWEGIDWSERARRAGWEIWFCPRAEVVHLGGVTVRQVPFRWVARSHRGMYRYFADRSRPAVRPLLAAAFAARAGLKSAALATRVWGYR